MKNPRPEASNFGISALPNAVDLIRGIRDPPCHRLVTGAPRARASGLKELGSNLDPKPAENRGKWWGKLQNKRKRVNKLDYRALPVTQEVALQPDRLAF